MNAKRCIPIFVECYDGQWQLTVMTSEYGEPLNLLRVAHGTWSKVSKMGELHILEEILATIKVSKGDKDLLMLNQLAVGSTEYHSLKIERKQGGSIHVQSTGGPLFLKSVAGEIVTCRNTDLWLNTDVHKPERRQLPKQIGLKPYKGTCYLLYQDKSVSKLQNTKIQTTWRLMKQKIRIICQT